MAAYEPMNLGVQGIMGHILWTCGQNGTVPGQSSDLKSTIPRQGYCCFGSLRSDIFWTTIRGSFMGPRWSKYRTCIQYSWCLYIFVLWRGETHWPIPWPEYLNKKELHMVQTMCEICSGTSAYTKIIAPKEITLKRFWSLFPGLVAVSSVQL